MSIRNIITEQITPITEAAIASGFRVFVTKPDQLHPTPANFAYVCRDIDGPFAVINGSSNRLETPSLAAPVRPHRNYGTAVLADYDESVTDAVRALNDICAAERVTVRFMGRNAAPVVPNYGRAVLERFSGGPAAFIELIADDLAPHTAASPTPEKELSHV
ncbi:hypothetical protein [Arthrobacter koreensis]|uniref:hypothetical protein n=1 Tax=Arthrobacter koreensis TaxID=199136 RepID=UPI0037F747A5